MILADMRTHLLGFTDLTTRLGDRIYVLRAPKKAAVPYIILSLVSGDPVYTLQGEGGVAQPLIQVAIWDRDPNGPSKVDALAELVRDKLSGWRGEWDETFVCDCLLQNEPISLTEPPSDSSDDWWHSVNQDYRVTHRRAIPSLS